MDEVLDFVIVDASSERSCEDLLEEDIVKGVNRKECGRAAAVRGWSVVIYMCSLCADDLSVVVA